MKTPTPIGEEQQRITVIFNRGSTWNPTIGPGNFPPNTTITLTFNHGDHEWVFPGVVDGEYVSWRIDAVDADQIPAGAEARIRCVFPDGPVVRAWAKGVVARDD